MTRNAKLRGRFALLVVGALALVAIVALGIGLTACGSGGGTSTQASGTPQKGGTLVVTFQADPQYLDPALDFEGNGWAMEHLVFNCLVGYATDTGTPGTKLTPDLATAVPTATNGGKTYTFKIRQGVKFAPPVDREVTAQDFKYSIERMMSLPKAPAKGYYGMIVGATDFAAGKAKEITGIKVLDASTLQVDLNTPDPTLLNVMAMPFAAAVPKEWVDKWGDQFTKHPLGTGPFYCDHWTPGTEIVFKRNPNYTLTDDVYLDEVKIQLSVTPTTAVLKLQSGEADVLGDYIPPADYVRVNADPKWKKQVVETPAIALDYLFMNRNVKPFDNLQVRQAISHAINRDKLVKLLSGTADPLTQIYPAGMPGHVDGSAGEFYNYDPAKAKEMLAAAGFANGFSTTLESHNVDPWPKVIQSLQNDLAQVGIKAEIKTMNKDAYWTRIGKATAVGIGLNDWWQDFPDPSDYVIPLFSKSSAIDEGTNPSFWWDPAVETELTQAQSMTDPAARIALFQTMQQQIMDQAPAVPLYQPKLNTMFSTRTGGGYLHPVWIFDFQHYWVSQ
jgi:ABC-type transport system substrate-binding protein